MVILTPAWGNESANWQSQNQPAYGTLVCVRSTSVLCMELTQWSRNANAKKLEKLRWAGHSPADWLAEAIMTYSSVAPPPKLPP